MSIYDEEKEEDELLEQFGDFNIYPNPARNQVIVELGMENEGGWDLRLYNSLGSEVMRVQMDKGSRKQVIDVGSLPGGVYLYSAKELGGERKEKGKLILIK